MTKTTEPVLEPCPFCGGETLLWDERQFHDYNGWFAMCGDCNASGDTKPTQPEAIAAWNTRPAPSRPVQPVAWLKEWTNQPDGEQYRRVDLRAESEDWLEHRKPTLTPLYTHPAPLPDVATLSAENERLREALREIIAYSQRHIDDTDAYTMSQHKIQAARAALETKQ